LPCKEEEIDWHTPCSAYIYRRAKMKELQTLTDEELLSEFLKAHEKYMAASSDFHIYLPKTQAHLKAQGDLNRVTEEINRRKKKKGLFS
jgi:hypothetical protein